MQQPSSDSSSGEAASLMIFFLINLLCALVVVFYLVVLILHLLEPPSSRSQWVRQLEASLFELPFFIALVMGYISGVLFLNLKQRPHNKALLFEGWPFFIFRCSFVIVIVGWISMLLTFFSFYGALYSVLF